MIGVVVTLTEQHELGCGQLCQQRVAVAEARFVHVVDATDQRVVEAVTLPPFTSKDTAGRREPTSMTEYCANMISCERAV